MRALAALVLAAALARPAVCAGPRAAEHRRPEDDAAASPADARQQILADLWRRRIISPDFTAYGPQDLALLERMRAAENAGAVELLQRTYHGLEGLAVVSGVPGSRRPPRARLTKDGFDKYLFLLSQQALRYFQRHDVEAKDAFQLRDAAGQKLFTPDGLLTAQGEALYGGVRAGRLERWKLPDGEVQGSRPMRPEAGAPPRPSAASAAQEQPEAPASSQTTEPEMSAPRTMGAQKPDSPAAPTPQ